MLVISRRAGEAIVIGDNIEIQVTDVTPSRVKLGIRAPRNLDVMRKEVRLAGERNRVASAPGGEDALQRLLAALRPSS